MLIFMETHAKWYSNAQRMHKLAGLRCYCTGTKTILNDESKLIKEKNIKKHIEINNKQDTQT